MLRFVDTRSALAGIIVEVRLKLGKITVPPEAFQNTADSCCCFSSCTACTLSELATTTTSAAFAATESMLPKATPGTTMYDAEVGNVAAAPHGLLGAPRAYAGEACLRC